jgi:DNA-binding transcriptional MerR regulator
MRLLTPAEFAQRIGVTPDTVRHWERTGRVRAFKTVSGRRLFREVDVRRLEAKRERQRAKTVDGPAGTDG